MAWVTVATTNFGDSSTYGYVYLQYDNASTGTSRTARLRMELKSGASVYIYVDNLALDGSSVRGRFLCQGTMDFWTGSLAAGTRKFTWSCPWYSGTRSYTCSGNIPSGVVAPSGLSVTLKSKTYNSASLGVSLSSYGTPSSTDGRYIEAAVLNQSTYGASYRYDIAKNTTSSTINISNSSKSNPSTFNIEGNHKYWYGGYATNTQASTSVVTGTFYTPCPPFSSLTFKSQTYASATQSRATIEYKRQSDGGAETRTGYYRYSTDNGSTYSAWTSFGTINASANAAATFNAVVPTSSNILLQAKINTPNGGDSTAVSVSFKSISTHTAPSFSNFDYRDTNSQVVTITSDDQVFIQGQSKPEIIIPLSDRAIGNDGVPVSNYSITFIGQSKTVTYSDTDDVSILLEAPSESGQTHLSVSAVDNLSLSKQVTKTLQVYPWSQPKISATIERVNNFETESRINASGTFSQLLINGTVKNSVTFEYRTKKSSSSEWSKWSTGKITIDEESWSIKNLSVNLDNNFQWDIEVRISDIFSSSSVMLSVAVGIPNFFIGTDGRISIGMKPNNQLSSSDRGQLEVSGPVYSRGNLLMPSHIGQVIMSTTLDTAAKVQAIYGGTWVAWGQGRLIGGVGSTTDASGNSITFSNGETGGSKTHNHTTAGHTLTLSEIPSHSHTIRSGWSENSPGSDSYRYQYWGGNDNSWKGGNLGTGSSGGGGSHSHGNTGTTNNWPPFIALYMWKRTA